MKKTRHEIAEIVKQIIIKKLDVDKNEVTEDADFIKDLKADSIDHVELVMEFEMELGITIPDHDTDNFQTVKNAIDYIFERQ